MTLLIGLVCSLTPNLAQAQERDFEFPLLGWGYYYGNPEGSVPATGLWKMERDAELDGELAKVETNILQLESANGRLSGRPQDKPANAAATNSLLLGSLLTGEVIPGSPAVVTLRQDHRSGYTAIYTGRLESDAKIVGSYVDTRGGAGDWSLTLITETVISPASVELPDELFFESVLGTYGVALRGDRRPFINLRPPSRNLWSDEIKAVIEPTLSYGEVDYIGTAKLIIPAAGIYTVAIPGAGVQFRINGQRVEAGDVELKPGLYDVEIYTNHWGQPYLTYAEISIHKQDSEERIPFVNTTSDIEKFLTQQINDQDVIEVCEYGLQHVDAKRE